MPGGEEVQRQPEVDGAVGDARLGVEGREQALCKVLREREETAAVSCEGR